MAEHVEQEQQEAGAPLRHLTKTDPDPRVRRRAHAVLLAEEGQTQASVARLFHTSAYRVHVWQERFAAEGRAGLLDRPRGGRPHALNDADRAFLEAALERGPQAYDLPMTVCSIRDLQALLERERGVVVSVDTVHRAVHALGLRSRRPRHDLTHRQDREAVAAAKHVLDWLQKTVGAIVTCMRTSYTSGAGGQLGREVLWWGMGKGPAHAHAQSVSDTRPPDVSS